MLLFESPLNDSDSQTACSSTKIQEPARASSRLEFCSMIRFPLLSIVFCCALLLSEFISPSARAADDTVPSFTRDIAPLLVKHCVACHGAKNPQGEYQLHTLARASVAGESENAPFVAGKPDESDWLRLVTTTDPKERMPKDRPALKPAEIDVLRRWIAAGAKAPGVDPAAPLLLVAEHPEPPAPKSYPRPLPIQALALRRAEIPDDDTILVGGYHEVTEWVVKTGKLVGRYGHLPQRIMALRLAPDGQTLAISGGEPGVWGSAAVWDLNEWKKLAEVARGTEVFFDAAWSADGSKLAIAGGDRSMRIWSWPESKSERKQLLEFEAHADWVRSVAWNSEGKLLITASRDKTARIHRAEDGHLLANYTDDEEPMLAALFTPTNEGFALSGGGKARVTEWFVATGDKYTKPKEAKKDDKEKKKDDTKNEGDKKEDAKQEQKKELTPQEKFDAEYEAKHLARANPFADGGGTITALARYEDKLLVAAGKTLRLYNCVNHDLLHTYEGAEDTLLSIAADPVRKRVVAGDLAGNVYIWEADQPQPQRVILVQPKE